jgi:medium-chain acyl-[acyl-carrier-protein] hydrolase
MPNARARTTRWTPGGFRVIFLRNMAVPSIWNEQRTIESFEVDMFGRLRPQALFGLLLNSAWNCAKGSPYGYEELSSRNLMWVLLKLHLRIVLTPGWGDRVHVQTWGKRAERFYALRDFAVSTSAGLKAASATTVWMIIDKGRGRPQRIDPETDGFPWEPTREEMETSLEKVPQLNGGQEAARYAVRFSDIDVNQHVNAARYLQWMVDSEPRQVHEERELGEIQLSFLAEALPGDEVAVHSANATSAPKLMSIRRTADGRELCRGSLLWRNRRL